MENDQDKGNYLLTICTQSYIDEVDLERAVFGHTGFGEDGDDDKRPCLVPIIPAQRLSVNYKRYQSGMCKNGGNFS